MMVLKSYKNSSNKVLTNNRVEFPYISCQSFLFLFFFCTSFYTIRMRPSFSWLLLAALLLVAVVCAARDYYDVLDVPRDAPKAQIKRHYKKLSRVYHPDKNPGDDEAEQKFMELANGMFSLKPSELK